MCDGSVIPRPLGVNPLLTISALSERCLALLARDRGWHIDYSLPSSPRHPRPAPALGIEFTEKMSGFISTVVTEDYEAAARQGQQDDSSFSFTLTIVADDLDRMLADSAHEARMLGTVHAPALSPEPITVVGGSFNLLVEDPERVDGRQMHYRMRLITEEGRRYWFTGFKTVHDQRGLDVWHDTTTLYVTLREEDDAGPGEGPPVARGILSIHPTDFMRQLSTIKVSGAQDARQRLEATARFGRFFGAALFDVYGSVAARIGRLDPHAPPRKKRPLRVSAPEFHAFTTDDDVQLRLTNYRGGPKGPVILSHGLGASSRIFSIDTIETNLLEFLYAHGYDVWLLDFRASVELPASTTRFSGDQVATSDYPAAVARVRALTGCSSVQMVAHCFGSTTFFMAMLAGLQGVRSAVCSQVATHMVTPALSRLTSALYMPDLLDGLGVDSLTAYTDRHANWLNRLYDRSLDLFGDDREEECDSAVCQRITFIYSLLYEHDQLNRATHNALHELFGVANIAAFEHLALMVREGGLRTADGSDTYLPHLERLAVPISFIHGAENGCFVPESTEKTFRLLQQRNGRGLYQRYVIANYGHTDCIFGKNAVRDVYPLILTHLETNA